VLEVCGDGIVNNNGAEACEPPGTPLCTQACSVRVPQCGDGFQTPPEQCEDGNLTNGDGCTSSCTLEFCGDGVVNDNGGEACEPPGTATCTDSCAARIPVCGDGFRTPPEQCEDGNLTNGDGCTSSCRLELCGDGVINNNGAEACEPPGTATCTDSCAARIPVCGDGFRTPPEQCEDGNLANGDGCTSRCKVELCGDGVINNNGTEACEPPGTPLCTLACMIRVPLCGDGFQTPPEQCEDGNLVDGDGCNSACMPEFCGDGVVNNNGIEACEPPGTTVCTDTCTARGPACGDGTVDAGEACDDGNTRDDDGCSAKCEIEIVLMPDGGMPMPDGGMPMPDAGVPMPDGGNPVVGDPDGGDAGTGGTGDLTISGCSVQRNGAPIDPSVLFGLLALVWVRRHKKR
jgi:cysteine-rich repeat protein